MLNMMNEKMAVSCHRSGKGLVLIDRKRGVRWILDEKTTAYGAEFSALLPQQAMMKTEHTLVITYRAGDTDIQVVFELQPEYLEVRIPQPEKETTHRMVMPGSFYPENEKLTLLLPIMQGMLWDGRGEAFSELFSEAHHKGFTMPFIGYLGERGGLLFTAETQDDVQWWVGKDQDNRIWAANIQELSLGSLRYERMGRIYLTDPDIVPIAKTYRRKVMAQGRFKSWEEKLLERPGLERIFGALMCFIGYCQDDVEYAAECRKLKEYGFDKALVYPGRFNTYHRDIMMGGQPAINLSTTEVNEIIKLGYDMGPWSWINEALDDGTDKIRGMYRKNAEGHTIKGWAIDNQQWHQICTSFMDEYQKGAINSTIPDMTWDHFDVLACASLGECYALDHPNHLGYPLSRSEDRQWIKKVFQAGRAGDRAVSSENFNDAFSLDVDFGSVKAWPQYGHFPFWPIPLTMLVYHDSIIHSWWEIHSYNNYWGGCTKWPHHYEYGGGKPRLMAAMDALMGCPPDVFPFGAQYRYTGRGTETMLYKFRFEDPEVQSALRAALPVAKLHGRIGKLEMTDFKFLSEDGYVQQTTFSDGTRVVANFSRDVYGNQSGIDHIVIDGIDSIMAESWKVIE